MVEHNNVTSFAEFETPKQPAGSFRTDWSADGRRVVISGFCPECRGATETVITKGIPGGRGILRALRRASDQQPLELESPLSLFCECGYPHSGRPHDALDAGCGRYWAAELTDEQRRPPAAAPGSK